MHNALCVATSPKALIGGGPHFPGHGKGALSTLRAIVPTGGIGRYVKGFYIITHLMSAHLIEVSHDVFHALLEGEVVVKCTVEFDEAIIGFGNVS